MVKKTQVISAFHKAISTAMVRNTETTDVPVTALVGALELLKEQEAIKPKLVGVNTWTCGECGTLLGWEDLSQSGLELINYKYCPGCGRRVKWE